jgi:N-hydroxyarylamine O-acetyltransferase
MAHDVDLDAYFARIGFRERPAADLATLRRLHALHPAAIPFENLEPLLGRPVAIDLPTLEARLIRGGRGGYCYQQNTLFLSVLRQIGFAVETHCARVMWNVPEGTVRPRNHMLLRVALPQGPYIADVGFGGVVLTGPLRLVADEEQATPHEPHRLVGVGPEYQLQVRLPDRWAPLYQFSLHEQLAPDWDVQNWYASTYPQSPFRQVLMAARALEGRRHTLLNNTLRTYRRNGTDERRVLANGDEIAAALTEVFGINLPEGCGPTLARIAASALANSP